MTAVLPPEPPGLQVPTLLPDVPDQPVVAVLLLFVVVQTVLLVRFYLSIMRGDLVPAREKDHWRDAFFAQQSTTQELLVTAEITRGVFRAMDPTVTRVGGGAVNGPVEPQRVPPEAGT